LAATSNVPGTLTAAKVDTTDLLVSNNTGSALGGTGTFTVRVTAFGFTLPSAPELTLFGSAAVNASTANAGSLENYFYTDPNNGIALLNQRDCKIIIGTNNSCDTGAALNWTTNSPLPFSITQIQTFQFAAGFYANTVQSTTVANVPEPTTTLLVGAALLGLALTTVRRKS